MSKECVNRYKSCRNNAGFTQEQAAELLHIAVRTLSEYENGGNVPDEIVAMMADQYRAPVLAWWHLKTTSVLGKFLPEIIAPTTHGDIAFLADSSKDELEKAVCLLKESMPKLIVINEEKHSMSMNLIKSAYESLFAIVTHAEQIKLDSQKYRNAG